MGITAFLTDHWLVAGLLLIILMMAESAPIIGFFIPGVLILPALGVVTGSDVWSFWLMYICAVTGSLLGDALGYWLGRVGAAEWSGGLFRHRRRRAVDAARKLVKERGTVAIFIGRFALLIHPAIPPAIGFLGVKLRTFMLIDPLAVGLWVLLYMGLSHIATGIWIQQTFEMVEIGSLLIIMFVVFLIVRHASRNIHHR